MKANSPIWFRTGYGTKPQSGTFLREGTTCNEAYVADENGNELLVSAHRVTLAPKEGMFANQVLYTDVLPFEIVEVRTANKIMVREMTATLDPTWKPEMIPGGFVAHTVNNDSQRWIYSSDPEAPVIPLRRRKDGFYYTTGGSRHRISTKPYKFHDYNF